MFLKLLNQIFKKNYYLLTALLFFLSFPSFDFLFLKGFTFFAWIALSPLFIFVRGKNYKRVYLAAFFTSFLGNLFRFYWIGYFAAKDNGGFYLILFILMPVLAIIFAFKILLSEILARKFAKFRYLIYPSIWIIFDWLMGLGYTPFTFDYLGHSQYLFTPFIQVSSFIGILGINYIIILFNYILADLFFLKIDQAVSFKKVFSSVQAIRFGFIIVFISLICLYGLVLLKNSKPYEVELSHRPSSGSLDSTKITSKEDKKDLTIACVQPCISPWKNWNVNRDKYLQDLKFYTKKSLEEKPDLIIWPESSTLETLSFNFFNKKLNSFEKELLHFIMECKVNFLIGEIGAVVKKKATSIKRYPQNNMVLINSAGKIKKTYSKIRLVPFGEWLPYVNFIPLWKKFFFYGGEADFVPGSKKEIFTIKNNKNFYRFATLICYEGTLPGFCRKFSAKGIDFFVNASNDGWSETYSGHTQHFAASVFRAIENGKWFIRVGNTGYTAAIDPYGRVKKELPILGKNYLVTGLDFSLNHSTFYNKYGDLFLFINFTFILFLLIRCFFISGR